jgi:hypothetical protein
MLRLFIHLRRLKGDNRHWHSIADADSVLDPFAHFRCVFILDSQVFKVFIEVSLRYFHAFVEFVMRRFQVSEEFIFFALVLPQQKVDIFYILEYLTKIDLILAQ